MYQYDGSYYITDESKKLTKQRLFDWKQYYWMTVLHVDISRTLINVIDEAYSTT